MFPASVVKQIDENLKYIVEKIETENSLGNYKGLLA